MACSATGEHRREYLGLVAKGFEVAVLEGHQRAALGLHEGHVLKTLLGLPFCR